MPVSVLWIRVLVFFMELTAASARSFFATIWAWPRARLAPGFENKFWGKS
jgi:hypothetical protein